MTGKELVQDDLAMCYRASEPRPYGRPTPNPSAEEGNINMPALKITNQRDLREAFSFPFMFLCKNIILLHACIYIGMYVWKKGREGYTFALAKEIS